MFNKCQIKDIRLPIAFPQIVQFSIPQHTLISVRLEICALQEESQHHWHYQLFCLFSHFLMFFFSSGKIRRWKSDQVHIFLAKRHFKICQLIDHKLMVRQTNYQLSVKTSISIIPVTWNNFWAKAWKSWLDISNWNWNRKHDLIV